MASGSRHDVYFIEEVTSGVTPATPAFDVFRCTKDSLDIKINYIESSEIRADREKGDLTPGTSSVEGTLGAELSFGTFDSLIAAAFCNDWVTNVCDSGILRKSFTFVSVQDDLTDNKYDIYRGCEISKISLKESAEKILEIEFDIVGRTHESAATLPTGATINARTTTPPMNALMGEIKEGGSAVSVITEADISIDNGIEARFVCGSTFSILPGIKSRSVTGSISAYFENNTIRNKYLQGTDSSLQITAVDPVDNAKKYVFDMTRIKYKSATKDVSGADDDLVIKLDYQAQPNATTGHSISVTRVGVV